MQAMDGFLIVLDKEANILYVSETITGYVGLSQVGIIRLHNSSWAPRWLCLLHEYLCLSRQSTQGLR